MRSVLTAAMHVLLLLAVTSSVSAKDTAQLQTNNLIPPPEAIDFDLSELCAQIKSSVLRSKESSGLHIKTKWRTLMIRLRFSSFTHVLDLPQG